MCDLSSAIRFCRSSRCSGFFGAFRKALRPGRIDANRGLQCRRAIDRKEHPLSNFLACLAPCIERSDDLVGKLLLHRDKGIVAGHRFSGSRELALQAAQPEPSPGFDRKTARIADAADAFPASSPRSGC